MNKNEQIDFVIKLSTNIVERISKEIKKDNFPKNWNEIELRKLLADEFKSEVIGMSKNRENSYNNILTQNGCLLEGLKKLKELMGMSINNLSKVGVSETFREHVLKIENISKQLKQVLKDGCSEKEIKEILSEISTPKQTDKLMSIAKDQIQKELDIKKSINIDN